jgi:transcriptional regulator with PAS, ATPase and Fis domain
MGACQVLLLHSPNVPLMPVLKLLEGRGFLVHLSRNWEETERTYALVSPGQLKYVFVDLAVCKENGWEQCVHRMQAAAADTVFIHFHSQFPQSLSFLLNRNGPATGVGSVGTDLHTPTVIGGSTKFCEVLSLANRYAPYDITVLITGETGTGKEVMAQYIHTHSARRESPLVACNMTAIPETLVESELFGYVKGAFTGADKNKKGLIEAAEGGTLFLDEIGDLPLAIQLKLLRFLESREFYRIGESAPKTADVRIIAATNNNMEKAIQEHRFREDLYYRLTSARIILPALRERKEDIPLLAEHFTVQACQQMQKPIKKISQSAQTVLSDYSWPGNIRELRNVIESAVLVSDGDYVTLADLPMHLQQYATGHREEISAKVAGKLDEAEKEVILAALREANGDKTLAAKRLGISTRTLYRKLEKYTEEKEMRSVTATVLS